MKTIRISILGLLAMLFSAGYGFAQAGLYDDVAVIVNDSSAEGLEIAAYYAQQRGIPAHRILHVQSTTVETVDSATFEDLKNQVGAALIAGNLLDSVNVLVTTKGMPLRASANGECDSLAPSVAATRCKCVEGGLSLVEGPFDSLFWREFATPNPFYGERIAFDRNAMGYFIVSRLDGYTVADVKAMIDRGGPVRTVPMGESTVLVDIFANYPGLDGVVFNGWYPAMNVLTGYGYALTAEIQNNVLRTGEDNLVGYVIYMRDTVASAENSYTDGAMVFAGAVKTAESFSASNFVAHVRHVADFVNEGAAVVYGNVGYYYAGMGSQPNVLMDLYLDNTGPARDAGTAYFGSLPAIGTAGLLVGDPKTSVALGTVGVVEAVHDDEGLFVYPNPTTGMLHLVAALDNTQAVEVKVWDVQGRQVWSGGSKGLVGTWQQTVDLGDASPGMYWVRMVQGERQFVQKIVLIGD